MTVAAAAPGKTTTNSERASSRRLRLVGRRAEGKCSRKCILLIFFFETPIIWYHNTCLEAIEQVMQPSRFILIIYRCENIEPLLLSLAARSGVAEEPLPQNSPHIHRKVCNH